MGARLRCVLRQQRTQIATARITAMHTSDDTVMSSTTRTRLFNREDEDVPSISVNVYGESEDEAQDTLPFCRGYRRLTGQSYGVYGERGFVQCCRGVNSFRFMVREDWCQKGNSRHIKTQWKQQFGRQSLYSDNIPKSRIITLTL